MTGELGRHISLKKGRPQGEVFEGVAHPSIVVQPHDRVSEIDGAILEFQDPLNVEMQGGDLREFLNERGALVGMSPLPEEHILVTLFRARAQKRSGLKDQSSNYERFPLGHPEMHNGFLVTIISICPEAKRCCKARDELSTGGGCALPSSDGGAAISKVVATPG